MRLQRPSHRLGSTSGCFLREYRFQATTETVEALRRLRGAWRGMAIAEHEVTIVLQDGEAVRIGIDTADVESL
ncbi:MAG TPA: hypothetical protein VGE27_18140, partial [Gemmatimonas sp.]|uniref:hypothetical protein n=1 Tax=Gemmatimonas sp. TaxID=1962908 RepID=UPI002EDB95AC